MPRNQDLNLLPIFDALVREENLSRAAERLGMSQPAVSKALQRLRLSFGDDLFVRTRRGISPTPRALELHRAFAPALDMIRQTYDAAPFSARDVDRTFNISMNNTVELLTLPQIMNTLGETAPTANIKIHPEHISDIPMRLKDGRLDYAIDFVPLPEKEFASHRVVTETLKTICAPDHPLAGRRVTQQQAQTLRHVSSMPRSAYLAPQSNQLLTPIEHLLGTSLPERKIVCHASGFVAIPEIVAHSDLVAIVPTRLAAPYLATGRLATLDLPIETPAFDLFLFWHRSRDSDPAHAWFADLLIGVTSSL